MQSAVKSNKGKFEIEGIETDIVCSKFDDKLFIIVTQFRKIGNLVLVTRDKALEDDECKTLSSKVLFGKDTELIHVISKTLALNIPVQKPILFGISLKDESPAAIKALRTPLKEVCQY